ncbi:MAG: hypothetical protein GY803_30655 [Chloroflexi bacterium]|nr:hypothetical protein [Chloroflexota bacterium]
MIFKSIYWIDILPSDNQDNLSQIAGKWLHFDDKEKIHALIDELEQLVESGDIIAAKIATKLPEHDPFPDKPCVLCIFTSNDPDEKEQVRNLIKTHFGITLTSWKSEEQTEQDWQPGEGFLWVQAKIIRLKREIESGKTTNYAQSQRQIITLTNQLYGLVDEIDNPNRKIEIYPKLWQEFRTEMKADLSEQNPPYDAVSDRLNNLERMLSTLTEKMTVEEQLTVQQKKRSKLRKNLNDHFGVTDLQEICFDLNIDYEDLPGDDKRLKVMELIKHMNRRGHLQELIVMCQELRPNLSW